MVRHDPAALEQLIASALPAAPAPGSLALIETGLAGIDAYSVYLPRTYGDDPARDFPLLMALHGGSGVGGHPLFMHNWGIPRLVWEQADGDSDWHSLVLDSFVIVSPHLTGGQFWEQADDIAQVLDDVVANHRVDPARITLTGLSRGGHGSWGLAAHLPGRFAAVAPMGGDVQGIHDYAPLVDMPIFLAHTARDEVVPVDHSHEAMAAIEARGGAPFAVYDTFELDARILDQHHVFVTPDLTTHDVWTPLYERPAFYRWLLTWSERSANSSRLAAR